MSTEKQAGWLEAAVAGEGQCEEISFRRSDQPGALVEVKLGDKTIQVPPATLLAAIRFMQLKGDNQ
jgi:hypothetical protein